MINYIIQVILFQVLFLAIYDFFLSKETFFIKIPTFQKAVPQEFIIYLPEIILSPEKVIQDTSWYQSVSYIDVLFWIGVSLFSMLFFVKLIKIVNLVRKYEVVKNADYTLVLIPNQTKAFSFFNFIFLGKEIPVSQQDKIIEHELVHSKQKHSLDLLFFEFLKIVMWFNPMIYIYQKRITLVHEYISDEVASKSTEKDTYINHLLSNFFQVENISFINQFYKQTFIKKRIIMMTKKQSKKMNQLKYLLLIPVLASMLFYVACSKSENNIQDIAKNEYQGKIKIDNEFYFIKKNKSGETIGFNSKGEKVDVLSLLPESVVAMNFEDGKLVTEFDYSEEKRNKDKTGNLTTIGEERVNFDKEDVSFMAIDKAPTFPGCETGDKQCFSKMVQKHFVKNFNSKLPNQLGLEAGKKRIFIGFKVNKEGKVVDVKVRAPHPKIKDEVLSVMNSLPNMIPGENNGVKVGVKYSIPFVVLVQ